MLDIWFYLRTRLFMLSETCVWSARSC